MPQQLHESCNDADVSTYNGQHRAEVQGDGDTHVGGCAPLTCLQYTDSVMSSHALPSVSGASYATVYAGMQQGRGLQSLPVKASSRQVQ